MIDWTSGSFPKVMGTDKTVLAVFGQALVSALGSKNIGFKVLWKGGRLAQKHVVEV